MWQANLQRRGVWLERNLKESASIAGFSPTTNWSSVSLEMICWFVMLIPVSPWTHPVTDHFTRRCISRRIEDQGEHSCSWYTSSDESSVGRSCPAEQFLQGGLATSLSSRWYLWIRQTQPKSYSENEPNTKTRYVDYKIENKRWSWHHPQNQSQILIWTGYFPWP